MKNSEIDFVSGVAGPAIKKVALRVILLGIIGAGTGYSQDKPELDLGGALRYNYTLTTFRESQTKRGGDFGFDVFWIDAKASYRGITADAEFRLYPEFYGGGMLKRGEIGYKFDDRNDIKVGLTQVPFGITTYNSNSWFYSINYYLGFEDDFDNGMKYTYIGKNLEFAGAFFKNAEELKVVNSADASDNRYSYDPGSMDIDGDGELDMRNKEINHINMQAVWKIKPGNIENRFGISAQYGGVYNLDTEAAGASAAGAVHYELIGKNIGVKAQASYYKYNLEGPEGTPKDFLPVTAYGSSYLIAAEGYTYTLGLSYSYDVDLGPISNLLFYNDIGYFQKPASGFNDTFMNVSGCMIDAGNLITYVDFGLGQNHAWIGPNWNTSFASGEENPALEFQFNINLGYYF